MTTEFHKGTYWDFVDMIRARMREDNDAVIAIDGYEGTGKSVLGLQLAAHVNAGPAPVVGPVPRFPTDHVIFDWDQWEEHFSFAEKRQTYLLDEGGNLALSRDAMSAGNKELLRILTQARQLNDCLIFCMPSFYWLDKYVREHRVKWWLHVEKRGEAVLLERTGDWRKGETWFEDTDSVFLFDALDKTDPEMWAEYVAHKKSAFLDRFDPRANVEAADPGEKVEDVLFDFDNLQGLKGKTKEERKRGVQDVRVQVGRSKRKKPGGNGAGPGKEPERGSEVHPPSGSSERRPGRKRGGRVEESAVEREGEGEESEEKPGRKKRGETFAGYA